MKIFKMLLSLIVSYLRLGNTGKKITEPWLNRTSIYKYLVNNLSNEGILTQKGKCLPDEERRFENERIKWVEGARDGVVSHHGITNNNQELAKIVADLVIRISKNNKLADRIELYEILTKDVLLDYVDASFGLVFEAEIPVEPKIYRFAKWLAYEAPDRGPVKYGIVFLGTIGNPEDINPIVALGKHDEFTLYSVVAIDRILENSDDCIWDIGKSVNGWGRIHAVERLSETSNPDIKSWLLLEGYKNEILYEYLAYICATAGNLHIELGKEKPSKELILAAGDLITSLISGISDGPAQDMSGYEYAAQVISDYIKNVNSSENELIFLNVVSVIKGYLESLIEEEARGQQQNGWSAEIINSLLDETRSYISRKIWAEMVKDKLNTKDEDIFQEVILAAQVIDLDIWETHFSRLKAKPNEDGLWFNVVHEISPPRLEIILQYANEVMALEKISTGPEDELGFGEKYEWHRCLDFLVQELQSHPGKGIEFVLTALNSPVVRNRNTAISTLSKWGVENWNSTILPALEACFTIEPNHEVKEQINEVISRKNTK
jgi:hypothetical protein